MRSKCTIVVLHSGNHEIIGIRHRETQTLYISHVIEPHQCSNPAYGKIHVGIYIAAVQEAIDRTRQDIEKRDPPADISPRNEEANPDDSEGEDLNDCSRGESLRPTRSNKRTKGSSSKGKQKARHGEDAERHGRGKVIDKVCIASLRQAIVVHNLTSQALLANAAKQNHVCLRLSYDIYDSPHPAVFRRLPDGPKKAPGHAKLQTPPLSPGRETTPIIPISISPQAIHITVHSELQHGSTGIVHIGTMTVDPSGPTAKVAVKLAFSRDEKLRLVQKHRAYTDLHSKGVRGIPRVIGLFIDEELLLGGEGPYALVMSYIPAFSCSAVLSTSRIFSSKQSTPFISLSIPIAFADALH